jgi:hypothetical protein
MYHIPFFVLHHVHLTVSSSLALKPFKFDLASLTIDAHSVLSNILQYRS